MIDVMRCMISRLMRAACTEEDQRLCIRGGHTSIPFFCRPAAFTKRNRSPGSAVYTDECHAQEYKSYQGHAHPSRRRDTQFTTTPERCAIGCHRGSRKEADVVLNLNGNDPTYTARKGELVSKLALLRNVITAVSHIPHITQTRI